MNDIKVYFKCMRIHLLSGLEYKGWWMDALKTAVFVLCDFAPTLLLFVRFGNLGTWTAERVLLVFSLTVGAYGTAELVFRGFDTFPGRLLQTGELDRLLLRPCRVTTQVACNIFHLHRFGRPVACLCMLAVALGRMGLHLGVGQVLTLLLAWLGGTLVYCGVFVFTSGLSVFTVKGLDWITLFTNASYQVSYIPTDFLPKSFLRVFTFLLPVLVVSYYPAAAVCGWVAPGSGLPVAYWKGLLALPVGAVFYAASLWVWGRGLRHYTSTGS